MIDNAELPAGAPMFFNCGLCGQTIRVPENYVSKPDLCPACGGEWSSGSGLQMWTVYDHPADAPYSYLARLSVIEKGYSVITDTMMCTPDLLELRQWLQELGLFRMDRFPHDDPKIVETWL